MSKAHPRKKQRRRTGRPEPGRFDGGIYFAVVFIGAVLVLFAFLITERRFWRETLVGYVALVTILTNLCAFQAYQGRPLSHWRAALARLPLRGAGFGGRHGRPIEAAHEADGARIAVMVSIAVSIVLLVLLGFLVIPGLR